MAFFNSKTSKLFLGTADLSAYLKEVSGLPGARPVNDITTLADSGFKGLPSIEGGQVTLDGLFSDVLTGLDFELDLFRAASSLPNGIMSHWPAGDTAGLFGHASEVDLGDVSIGSRVGDLVTQRATFQTQGPQERIRSIEASNVITATQNGSSVDDTSSSSAGGSWYYHITAFSATGGNARWQILLEDSVNDSTFATLSATQNITAKTSIRTAIPAGTMDRHLRVVMTLDATSGSLTFSVGYNRAGVF